MKNCRMAVALCCFCFAALLPCGLEAAEPASLWRRDALNFSGYSWDVKSGYYHPGKNHWSARNVWVDEAGWLHLRLAYDGELWQCAEISTGIFGYGLYRFYIAGRIDQMDAQTVFGLFLYPGPRLPYEANAEIDIEFSRWGRPEALMGNFSVIPATVKFPIELNGEYSTHQFLWLPDRVEFSSYHGDGELNESTLISRRIFRKNGTQSLPTPHLQLHINYWLFKGRPPVSNLPQEILIRKVEYLPFRDEPAGEGP